MDSNEDYTSQIVRGWIYQVIPGYYGYYLEIWHPEGREYRNPKAFEQYDEAVGFAKSLIAATHPESNRLINSEDGLSFDPMMRQLVRVECDDCIYQEWHIKSYEDCDNDWDVYAIDPVIGKAEISLKRQADLQEAIAQMKVEIEAIEAVRHGCIPKLQLPTG